MRRLTVWTLLVAGLVSSAACRSNRGSNIESVEEEAAPLRSAIEISDATTGLQLVDGFHDLEPDGWRWTKGKFAVTLKIPEGAAQRGAILTARLTVPEPVLARVKQTTLSAVAGGASLPPETFAAAGEQTYRREVPASALVGGAITVDFALDKFIAAGEVEQRELGLIASAFALESR